MFGCLQCVVALGKTQNVWLMWRLDLQISFKNSPWWLFCFFCPTPSGLFQTKSSQVQIMGRDERDPFSLRRIPSVWTSSWRRPSNTAAPRGLPLAVDQRMITTRRSAGRSEKWQTRVHAAADVLGLRSYSRVFICQGFFSWYYYYYSIFFSFFFFLLVKKNKGCVISTWMQSAANVISDVDRNIWWFLQYSFFLNCIQSKNIRSRWSLHFSLQSAPLRLMFVFNLTSSSPYDGKWIDPFDVKQSSFVILVH